MLLINLLQASTFTLPITQLVKNVTDTKKKNSDVFTRTVNDINN